MRYRFDGNGPVWVPAMERTVSPGEIVDTVLNLGGAFTVVEGRGEMTVSQLRAEAESAGIANVEKLKKQELIAALAGASEKESSK